MSRAAAAAPIDHSMVMAPVGTGCSMTSRCPGSSAVTRIGGAVLRWSAALSRPAGS